MKHQHRDYKEELDRLNYTLDIVDKTYEISIKERDRLNKEVSSDRKHFDAANSQSYIQLMVDSMLKERYDLRIRNLEKASDNPYFARIDFIEENKSELEKIYIGKMVLIRDDNQELVIVDWRAPIANLYYENRIGEASYLCPDGQIKGELTLKRQFSIHNRKLHDVFDIDITTNDEFLQKYLGANADNRLKDIVSTIQVEQNKIIRADMWKPLIVQGAAGSGKTTIALHRIAYLIYTYEKRFNPENFMIIAPNKLFLNYISSVLPDLGVEKVKQTTFQDFALELIGKKLKIKDANEKLINFVNNDTNDCEINKNNIIKKISEFKASFLFKEVIDEYIAIIEKTYIPREAFKIASIEIFSYEEINNLFLSEYKNLPLMKRVEEIKKHMTNKLKRKKDNIIQSLQNKCDAAVMNLKYLMEDTDERRGLIIAQIEYKDETIKKLEALSKKAVKEYIDKISKANPFEYYKNLIFDSDILKELINLKTDFEYIEQLREYSMDIMNSNTIEIEDLAPIIYIKYKIYGMDEKIPVKHIVIDEAQDFSVFQFYVLRNIIKDSSFTILGDLCQGIHSYRGINNWEAVMNNVFNDRQSQLLTLEKSYRTTVQIMKCAVSVLKAMENFNMPFAEPVIRHGEKVDLISLKSFDYIVNDIEQKIENWVKHDLKSIAIICKTMDDCTIMKSSLKKYKKEIYIITGSEKEYKGGIVIVPSYLSKGLEFDAVIISDGGCTKYKKNELDAKLLYVSMTRPLHKLIIYYNDSISPLLKNLPNEYICEL